MNDNLFASATVIGPVPAKVYAGQLVARGHPDYVISRSSLMAFVKSPSKWLRTPERLDDTEATEWGTLMDCRLLTPGDFDSQYIVEPETYPATPRKKGDPIVDKPWNRGANFCKEWAEDNARDKVVLSYEELRDSNDALKVLIADKLAIELLARAQVQTMVTGFYKDRATGLSIPVKAHLDIIPQEHGYRKCLADFKTAKDGHPASWRYVCRQRGYHVQAVIHSDLWTAATSEDRTDWLHLVQENTAPWEVTHMLLSGEMLEKGREEAWAALRFYAACLKANRWPASDKMVPHVQGWALIEPDPGMASALPPKYEESGDMLPGAAPMPAARWRGDAMISKHARCAWEELKSK